MLYLASPLRLSNEPSGEWDKATKHPKTSLTILQRRINTEPDFFWQVKEATGDRCQSLKWQAERKLRESCPTRDAIRTRQEGGGACPWECQRLIYIWPCNSESSSNSTWMPRGLACTGTGGEWQPAKVVLFLCRDSGYPSSFLLVPNA